MRDPSGETTAIEVRRLMSRVSAVASPLAEPSTRIGCDQIWLLRARPAKLRRLPSAETDNPRTPGTPGRARGSVGPRRTPFRGSNGRR